MKLHLACWHRYIPGFVHVDIFDMPHIDHVASMDKLPFIADNSVDLIYCCGGLTYFHRWEADKVMQEWYRVLKPNGVLRLSTPNPQAFLKLYFETGDLRMLDGPIFGHMKLENSVISQKCHYDENLLSQLFTTNNFYQIEHWDWRNTEHANVDDFSQSYWPHMQKDTGVQLCLNMQAKKYVRPTDANTNT